MSQPQNIPIVEDLSFAYPEVTPWGWIIAGSAIGLASAVLLVFLARRWWRRTRRINALKRPHRQALRELKEAFGGWRTAGYLAFLFQLTYILRRYLARRFGLAAPAGTTAEVMASVEMVAAIGPEMRGDLRELLLRCDLIKFAALPTGEGEVERLYGAACDFVKTTAWRK